MLLKEDTDTAFTASLLVFTGLLLFLMNVFFLESRTGTPVAGFLSQCDSPSHTYLHYAEYDAM